MSTQETTYTVKEVTLGFRFSGTLYEPATQRKENSIGIVSNYIWLNQGHELAKRGYTVLSIPQRNNFRDSDDLFKDIDAAIRYMKQLDGITHVAALSWSGGCSVLTAYQSIAENGCSVFQGSEYIIGCGNLEAMTPADALILMDSNWGNGTMTLVSLDPAVTDETGGMNLDPELDLFNPANGFCEEGSSYSDEFIKKFLTAQGERMNRLIDHALSRLTLIRAGKGRYVDDEPLVIPGGEQLAPFNKLFPQDIRLLSRTKGKYPLLHGDGSCSTEQIRSLRLPFGGTNQTANYHATARITSVVNFLKTCSVPTDGFGYNQDSMWGVNWERCYSCTPGNIKHVSCPVLILGMTGGYEFLAAETIYHNAASKDKTIAFIEGADHLFHPNKAAEIVPGQFGDTEKTTFDYISRWLEDRQF